MGPPVAGHVVRFERTVSKPPQGKLGAVESSKPRAGGQLRRKWAEVRGRRERRARALCMVAVFLEGGGVPGDQLGLCQDVEGRGLED